MGGYLEKQTVVYQLPRSMLNNLLIVNNVLIIYYQSVMLL